MYQIYIEYPDGTIIEGEHLACGLDETAMIRDHDGLIWARLDLADVILSETDDIHPDAGILEAVRY